MSSARRSRPPSASFGSRNVPAISDSSPLILYAAIGRLQVLRELFHEVVIPPAVRLEVVDDGVGRPGAEEVARAAWIREQSPTGSPAAHGLPEGLDVGEAEVIALGLESAEPMLLLMDDRA